MFLQFTKSLDRPVDIFGLKGKWIIVFLASAGFGLLLGIVMGIATTSGIGISVVLLFLAVSFVTCILLQGKVSHRQLSKFSASFKVYPAVLRHERLNYIISSYTSEQSWFNKAQTERDEEILRQRKIDALKNIQDNQSEVSSENTMKNE